MKLEKAKQILQWKKSLIQTEEIPKCEHICKVSREYGDDDYAIYRGKNVVNDKGYTSMITRVLERLVEVMAVEPIESVEPIETVETVEPEADMIVLSDEEVKMRQYNEALSSRDNMIAFVRDNELPYTGKSANMTKSEDLKKSIYNYFFNK